MGWNEMEWKKKGESNLEYQELKTLKSHIRLPQFISKF